MAHTSRKSSLKGRALTDTLQILTGLEPVPYVSLGKNQRAAYATLLFKYVWVSNHGLGVPTYVLFQ